MCLVFLLVTPLIKRTEEELNQDIDLNPGHMVVISKGTYHWDENKGSQATVVFAVFSPAFDTEDRRPANK